MTKGANKEYFKNTAILFVGKIATQFVSLLLIPLYTRKLASDDYGLVDLLQTYINLFVPILIFKMDSAVLRFLIETRGDRKRQESIITNSFIVTLAGAIITCLIYAILSVFFDVPHLLYVFINILALMLSSLLMQILRGLGEHKKYAVSCIVAGVSNLITSLVLILLLDFGAESILIASSVSNLACSVYIAYKLNIKKYIKPSKKKQERIAFFAKICAPDDS